MKNVIIYDLDHTLYDSSTIDKHIFAPAFKVLSEANLFAKYDEIAVKKDFFSISFNAFLEKYLDEGIKHDFVKSLRSLRNFPTLKTYDDAYLVKEINTTNYLVTSGLREFQNQKIDALGIRDWFAEIYIDDPIDPKWKDKQDIIKHILNKHNYYPIEVLVVGDNPESEIKAGNQLGIETIQILRDGIIPSKKAKYQIKSLHELNTYIKL